MVASLFNSKRRELARLEEQMGEADSYEEWRELAAEHDRVSDAEDWRHDDKSSMYDYRNIRARLENLRELRDSDDDHGLLFALNEGIHGNMGGMGNSGLHSRAKCGTKVLIENYVREIESCLDYLAPADFPDIPLEERLEFYERASHCYGRSALMLSGGGTLGFFHLGVVKTLIEHKMMPAVISGASAGSFISAIVGTRTDREFLKLFENGFIAHELSKDHMDVELGFGRIGDIDTDVVRDSMARLIPDLTFEEAYRKTGRSINISISPAEPRQTSRLLNHIASPNVTIRSAVMASTALPGVFPPVRLEAKNAKGRKQPYLPARRWIDGSFSHDLPAKRLARMYGVNHFIVSQVMPVLGSESKQWPFLSQLMLDTSVAASKQLLRGSLDFIQRRSGMGTNTATTFNAINSLLDQSFSGDINIYPGFGILSLTQILKAPDEEETAAMIKAGERATWPKVATINTTTRIGRALDRILGDYDLEHVHWLRTSSEAGNRKSGSNTSDVPGKRLRTAAAASKKKPKVRKKAAKKSPAKRKPVARNTRRVQSKSA